MTPLRWSQSLSIAAHSGSCGRAAASARHSGLSPLHAPGSWAPPRPTTRRACAATGPPRPQRRGLAVAPPSRMHVQGKTSRQRGGRGRRRCATVCWKASRGVCLHSTVTSGMDIKWSTWTGPELAACQEADRARVCVGRGYMPARGASEHRQRGRARRRRAPRVARRRLGDRDPGRREQRHLVVRLCSTRTLRSAQHPAQAACGTCGKRPVGPVAVCRSGAAACMHERADTHSREWPRRWFRRRWRGTGPRKWTWWRVCAGGHLRTKTR